MAPLGQMNSNCWDCDADFFTRYTLCTRDLLYTCIQNRTTKFAGFVGRLWVYTFDNAVCCYLSWSLQRQRMSLFRTDFTATLPPQSYPAYLVTHPTTAVSSARSADCVPRSQTTDPINNPPPDACPKLRTYEANFNDFGHHAPA